MLAPPRLAVVIGIDGYRHGVPPLRNAVRDARAVTAALAPHGFLADDGTLIELLDDHADLATLTELFGRRLRALVTDQHRVVVYFAGHGQAAPDQAQCLRGYLLPCDAERGAQLLDMELVRAALAALPCQHLLVMLDCCSAGMFARSAHRDIGAQRPPLMRARYDAWQRRRSYQLLASAAYDEQALDAFAAKVAQDASGDHSPFARAVIDALTMPSPADGDRDGVICATEIYLHVRRALAQTPGGRDQTPNLWPLDWHDGGELTFLFGEPRFFVPGALAKSDSPYRGLAPFRTEDAGMFFGRRAVAAALAARVRAAPLTFVVGPSGAGKTSLLGAGLIPLIRGELAVLGPIRLGGEPLAELAALARQLAGEARPIAVILDPLEELFTMTHAAPRRDAALAALRFAAGGELDREVGHALDAGDRVQLDAVIAAFTAHRARLHLVLALRSDYAPLFHGRIVSAERMTACQFVVPVMNRDELRDCIERPAEARFLIFSPELGPNGKRVVETLLDELEQVPGGLPLLAVALDEMFRAYVASDRDDCTIGWAEYTAVGGAEGALRSRAETVYAFDDGAAGTRDAAERRARQDTLRDLMLRMVSLEGGGLARRRVARASLVFADPAETARATVVLDALIAARLVIAGDDHIEPAHDALLRGWPKVVACLDPARAALFDRLDAAVAEWRAAPATAQRLPLWDDDRLAALDLLVAPARRRSTRAVLARVAPSTLTLHERDFLVASDRARRRGQRVVRATIAAVVVVLFGAAVFSQLQRAEAERQRAAGQRLLMQAYLEQARQAVVGDGQPLAALPYLVAARDGGVETDAARRLFAAASAALPVRVLAHPPGDHLYVRWTDDHQVVVGSDRGVRGWDVARGQPVGPEIAPAGGIQSLAPAPDGARVAVGGMRGTALWRLRDGAQELPVLPSDDAVRGLAFSRDGTRLLTIAERVTVWDLGTHRPLRRPPPLAGLDDGALADDGRRVMAATRAQAEIWQVDSGAHVTVQAPAAGDDHEGTDATLSGDGRWLALAVGGTAQLFNAATGAAQAPSLALGASSGTPTVQFARDGTRVLTANDAAGTARLWSIDGAALTPPFGDDGLVTAELDRSEERVLATGQTGVRVWDAQTGRPLTPTIEWLHDAHLASELSADATWLAMVTADGDDAVWALAAWLPVPVDVTNAPDHEVDAVVRLAPCGDAIVAQTEARSIRVWRAAQPVRPLAVAGDVLACDPAGAFAVIRRATGDAELHALARAAPAIALAGGDQLTAAAVCPGGDRIIAARGSQIRAWSARTGALEPRVLAEVPSPEAIACGPDGVRIWSRLETRSIVHAIDPRGRARWPVVLPRAAVMGSFSADGRRLILATAEPATVEVWDAASGALVMTAPGVTGVLSADGALAGILAADHAQVWEVGAAHPLTPLLPLHGDVRDVAFATGDGALAASDAAGGFFVWALPADHRSIAAWRALVAGCSPFVLRAGVLRRAPIDAAACGDAIGRAPRL